MKGQCGCCRGTYATECGSVQGIVASTCNDAELTLVGDVCGRYLSDFGERGSGARGVGPA